MGVTRPCTGGVSPVIKNKNGGGALRLGLRFEGQKYLFFSTSVNFASMKDNIEYLSYNTLGR